MRRTLLVSALVFGLQACSASVVNDLDDFCNVVSEVNRDNTLNAEKKLSKIEARKSEYEHVSGPEDVFQKLPGTPPERRYGVLQDAAKVGGKPAWSCLAYQELMAALIAEEAAKTKAAEPPPPIPAELAPPPAAEKAKPVAEKPGKKSKKKGKHKK